MDYYSILRPAIEALNPSEPRSRAAVYNRARKIVSDRAASSATGNAKISDELRSLEDAIGRIEQEFSEPAAAESEFPEPSHLDLLRDRSDLMWKAAAAVVVFGILAVGGFVGFSFWTTKEPAREVERIQARAQAIDVTETDLSGDHRPYTLRRQLVYYRTTYPPGALVISKSQKFLYLVRPNVAALRYSIAVGRKCTDSVGLYQISEKEEFPGWDESAPKGQTEPLSPLLATNANPLGARALYLERDERLIHGISRAVGLGSSLACFQLMNDDVIDLFNRVPVGTRVVAVN
jgi:lipoprotein-anchoring transpeptidase ErfK/SrfK